MKQLRQISILVRGAQLLLLVLALFLVVWLVPDAGKKHPGRKLRKLRQMAAMWRRMKKMEPPGIWRMMDHPPGK